MKWTNSVAAAGEIEKKRIKERNMLNASCRTRLRSLVIGQSLSLRKLREERSSLQEIQQ